MCKIILVLSIATMLFTHCTNSNPRSNTSTFVKQQPNNVNTILKKDDKYGIQKGSKVIIPFRYDAVNLSSNKQYYWVFLEGKYGLYTLNGTEVYPCVFTEYEDFETNRSAIVLHEERYYLLNPTTGLMIEESESRYKEALLDLDKEMSE